MFANVLQPLIDFAHAILRFFHDQAGFSWGASIIALTVTVRLLILPLTFKQVRAMQNMQRLQPEIKRIQERYKGDKQRTQQEMMRFYQQNKVNPLGSCLPIVLQLPFFISLFYLLRSAEFQHDIQGAASFLFIPNLAQPATGVVLAVLLVMYVVTQLGASLVTAVSADKNQRRLMLALPFVFVVFISRFQAGLIVYWITTNVWTVGQQLAVKKFLPAPAPIEGKVGEAKAAVGTSGNSSDDGKSQGGKSETTKASDGGAPKGAKQSKGAPPASPRKKKRRSGRRR
jgi:YidC/Oxa1 family membrane protein insertase